MRHVIVGGGQAAVSAAAKLRELDARADILIVGDEPVLPYQRPPLSKKYLSGEMPLERLVLRPREWFAEQRIETRFGTSVGAIERGNSRIMLDDGTNEAYDRLLLATGTRVRKLPAGLGDDLQGVHYLRTVGHIDAMRAGFREGQRLVIVGGGYIGLEAAAVARSMGLSVTVVEAASRILQRVACPETSAWFADLHRARGVLLLEGRGLDRFEGDGGVLKRVRLSDDTVLDADIALVGIGVLPNDTLATEAGLTCDNGVVVDARCQTSDRAIFAAGDCASFPYRTTHIRLESVPNAIHQGEVAAANMAGLVVPYEAKPWFWSDQYEIKLQIAGLGGGYDRIVVRPGKREGSVSHWYFAGDTLLAVDAMNDAPAFMTARRLIENAIPISPQQAETGELKALVTGI